MTEDLLVRRYRPGDRDAVWALHDRAFRASLPDFDPEMDRHLRAVERTVLDAGGEFLVGTLPVPPADPTGYGGDGERVVAAGGYVPVGTAAEALADPPVPADAETVELRSLQVDPAHRREGYGRQLVRDLERRARDDGVGWVVLTAAPELSAARALYRSEGYEPVDAGDDLVVFRKRLSAHSGRD